MAGVSFKPKLTFLAILFLSLFGGPSFAEDLFVPSLLDVVESTKEADGAEEAAPIKGTPVTAIEIKGNKLISDKEILDAVFSRVGDAVLETKVKADVKAIYGLGYFADVNADTAPYGGGEKITYSVVENPVIKAIVFDGNQAFSDQTLIATMETAAGRILNFKVLREDMKRLNELYHSSGYILARVIDVSVDPETDVLMLKVVEGVVEDIRIEGNDVTQDYVILREFKTKPGSVLNDKVLTKDLRNIFNLGFFSEVNPAFEPGSDPNKVVLVVRVTEQRTSTINFGGGYGEREGWFGFADLSINNLFGTGQALMIRGQTGAEVQTYQFKYFNPWVLEDWLGDHTSFTFKRWYTIGSDFYFLGQNEIHNGWDIAFGKPLADVWKLTYSFGGEWVGPYGDSSFEAYDTLVTGVSLAYDTRDFWLNPTEGVNHIASTRWGWKYLGGAITQFMKYGLDFNFYFPLAERQTLALHGGTALAVGDVPIGERYWVGGANTVRGFYPNEAQLGFRKLLSNVEYRYTFNEIFQGVVFFDYGGAWYSGAPVFGDFISGTGFGVRLTTPLGPIRLDYGIGSGKSFGEGVIHFSIGQAF